uniref:FA complementation group C n=1 Tax=Echeneis naucrates TaxID=173247 RepID=A0A665X6F4_ECHNA
MTKPLLNVQDMQIWLDKVVAWGQTDSPDTQKDTSLHLKKLSSYLRELLTHINNTSSTSETMKTLPSIGQFLGRLCWNPYVTADGNRSLLFQCLWGLFSEHPTNAVERKANQWIRKVLCQLTTEEDVVAQALMKSMGIPPEEYHVKVLKKVLCSCDSVRATSEACVPLVACPEAAPLIDALLQRPVNCVRAPLSQEFLDAVSSAYSSQDLSLEEQSVLSLWYHSLPSLEKAVLNLLESVFTNSGSTPQKMEEQVAQSLLLKACAQHCSIFLVVNDIFRNFLKQVEANECVKSLIQTFTSCFLREVALMQPQVSLILRSFFPQSSQSLLVPLLTLPSDEFFTLHEALLLNIVISLLFCRRQHKVFEAWFLLVQCAHWIQVTVQLLGTSGCEDCGPLLWLLTFYHHPTNRGHNRVHVKEVWDHLRSLFSISAHPFPVDYLQSLVTMLSPQPQQPSASPLLILSLLVNFAVFSQQSLSGSTRILQTVRKHQPIL